MTIITCPAMAAVKVQTVEAAGITAWLVEDHHIPALSVHWAFRDAGTASDTAALQGRASLFADLLMKGAGAYDEATFLTALEEKAITLDAAASRDTLTFRLKTLAEHREAAFALLADAMLRPHLHPDKLAESKIQALAALKRLQESPDYRAQRALASLLYGEHPYAYPAMGTEESVERLTSEDLQAFHATHLAKGNAIIAVVGAIDADTLAALLATHFSELPETFAGTPPPTMTPAAGPEEVSIVMDVPQSVVAFGLEGVARHDPDFYAAFVMNEILGGSSLTSRLSDAVREKRGLTYHIGTGLDTNLYASVWQGGFATKRQEEQAAVDAMRETLRRFVTEGVSEEELARAKGKITGSFPLSIDDNDSIAAYLIGMQLFALGADYLEKRNDYFAAVTRAQVNNVAKRLISPETLIMVRVGRE